MSHGNSYADNKAIDKIYEAVEAALDANWDPYTFAESAAESWEVCLKRRIEISKACWTKMTGARL